MITVTSRNNEQIFNDINVINIGTAINCNYRLDLPFELVISLQKQPSGRWRIINTSKSEKVLFKGKPIGIGIEFASVCKLMIDDTEEFIGIKITESVENSLIIANSPAPANKLPVKQPKMQVRKKDMVSIGNEELNEQDIEVLYGKGVGAQTKIKIDRKKADIEKRRASISKEISYKSNDLRTKIAQNEIILNVLNAFIVFTPLIIAFVLNDVIKITANTGEIQTKILFLMAIALIIVTMLLKQAQFLILRTHRKVQVSPSVVLIKNMCSLLSMGTFFLIIVFALVEIATHKYGLVIIIPQMILLCSFLCICIGIFSGFTKNIIAESGEELDSYENREDFQAVVKDYQQWVYLFVNNISKKKLRDINGKIFNLQLMCAGEYLLGVLTAPFLAYGVSQTLAECFPEAAGWIRLAEGFKFSPIFLTLATLMIIFAFHCYAVAFSTSKRVFASNVIKQDGFSDYNVHGVMIHGVESTKNLKKEAKKFFLIATGVVIVEITMNMSYFVGVMGGNIQGLVLSFITALIPTALLIMETNMVANTKFEIKIREELMDKVDKNY